MLTRRSLLRRAVGALAAGTLAGVSRWLPAPKAEDWFVLDEAIPVVIERDWQWYDETSASLPPLTRERLERALESVRVSVVPPPLEVVSPAERRWRLTTEFT